MRTIFEVDTTTAMRYTYSGYLDVQFEKIQTLLFNDALFRTAAAGKVVLSKLASSVPIDQPSDVRKANLYKSIAANNTIPASFRMHQCETFSLPRARSTVWRLGVTSAPEKP